MFEQLSAGPYHLFVTIRPPTVIPGVAAVEVRAADGPRPTSVRIAPVPLTGEGSKNPPTPDAMRPSPADPAFFTGSLWLMASGSWQVRFQIEGPAGPATGGVPVPAVPLSVLPMQRSLEILLAILAAILVFGMVGIVGAAVRESQLAPGVAPTAVRRRRALMASAAALGVMVAALWFGNRWWDVEAAAYASRIYRPSTLEATLSGDRLDLRVGELDLRPTRRHSQPNSSGQPLDQLLPDHGHLMHLYAIRYPLMDAAFHLHPEPSGDNRLTLMLPALPPGTYKLFADVVHRNGFPETVTATINIPPGLHAAPLGAEDASAFPPPLNWAKGPKSTAWKTPVSVPAGILSNSYRLRDGYRMVWDRPETITAGKPYVFRFQLLDPSGKPATDMQRYLGMAGHAAFVKTDFSTFAHTHPEGSAAMPAMMMANAESDGAMAGMQMDEPVSSTVEFPYGFPSSGNYRIFVQMKHSGTVETGVFDATVR